MGRFAVVIFVAGLLLAGDAGLERRFEAALHAEMVDGDLKSAASQYREIVSLAAGDRGMAAQALLQMAGCEERSGLRDSARRDYARVVKEYADQAEISGRARLRLASWTRTAVGPQNLDFEHGVTGWVTQTGRPAEVRHAGCRSVLGCAVMAGPGRVLQHFGAGEYRGKTVRLRAWLRVEGGTSDIPGDRAQMWLSVDRAGGRRVVIDEMNDRPVRSARWTECEIAGEIDGDAASVEFGVSAAGAARVWIDEISFGVIPEAEIAAARAAIHKTYDALDGDFPQTEVMAMKLAGNGALVTVRVEYAQTVDTRLDTWVRDGGWRLKERRVLTTRQVDPIPDAETMRRAAADLKKTAAPLATIETGHTFYDLAPFGNAVGDARVVALGEATLGTREFFQIKERLLEYLAKEKGFTVFAIDVDWLDANALDVYIKSGEGDPKALLTRMLWPWNTEEALEVVEWMREFNRDGGGRRPLRFASFGIAPASVVIPQVVEYLKKYSPLDAVTAQSDYGALLEMEARMGEVYDDGAARAAQRAEQVVKLLDARREALVQASTEEAWRAARQAAEMARQNAATRNTGKELAYGNEMKARNIEWLLTDGHPGEKVVLWGHNTLLGYSSGDAVKSVGSWLREEFGERVYVTGFAFHRGELLAMGVRDGQYEGVARQKIPAWVEGSGDRVLSAAGMAAFFLDLRSVSGGTALGRWLNEAHSFLEVGALWNRDDEQSNSRVERLGRSYDGVVFLEEGHAARGL